jgi:hypothetical protein
MSWFLSGTASEPKNSGVNQTKRGRCERWFRYACGVKSHFCFTQRDKEYKEATKSVFVPAAFMLPKTSEVLKALGGSVRGKDFGSLSKPFCPLREIQLRIVCFSCFKPFLSLETKQHCFLIVYKWMLTPSFHDELKVYMI